MFKTLCPNSKCQFRFSISRRVRKSQKAELGTMDRVDYHHRVLSFKSNLLHIWTQPTKIPTHFKHSHAKGSYTIFFFWLDWTRLSDCMYSTPPSGQYKRKKNWGVMGIFLAETRLNVPKKIFWHHQKTVLTGNVWWIYTFFALISDVNIRSTNINDHT